MNDLDNIILKYIHVSLRNFNVYVNEDIIWVFYKDYWVLNVVNRSVLWYREDFFWSIKDMFLIDDDKLNNIIYIYTMNLLNFDGPLEIQEESFPWEATLEGINKRIEVGAITVTNVINYGTEISQ